MLASFTSKPFRPFFVLTVGLVGCEGERELFLKCGMMMRMVASICVLRKRVHAIVALVAAHAAEI
jgi:hypothetical protein